MLFYRMCLPCRLVASPHPPLPPLSSRIVGVAHELYLPSPLGLVVLLEHAGVLQSVEFKPEEFPCSTVYLEGQSGRVAADIKQHYRHQQSSVLLAHKATNFTLHGRAVQQRRQMRSAPSERHDPPREAKFEDIGLVVASKHPATKTYLHPSMADHLMTRCACVTRRVVEYSRAEDVEYATPL